MHVHLLKVELMSSELYFGAMNGIIVGSVM